MENQSTSLRPSAQNGMTPSGSVQKTSEGFGNITHEKSSELAAVAVAASARAEVESAYVMALKKPRSEEDARVAILKISMDPDFAEKAKYRKPVGGSSIEGPSIRFAEEMLRHWGNVKTMQTATYEDDLKRIVKVTVIDLESNISYSKEVTIEKTVERRNGKGREIISERLNTNGERVFIVKATEDELMNKEAAAVSKIIRNNGLRLIPQHIIDAAMDMVEQSLRSKVNKDPDAEKRKILDAFASLGINPSDIEKYLGCSINQITPAQVVNLRGLFAALKDGQTTWADCMADKGKDGKQESAQGVLENLTAESPDKHQPVTSTVKGNRG